jgi:hypothetical protein
MLLLVVESNKKIMFYVIRYIFLLFKVNLKLSASSFQRISKGFDYNDDDEHLNRVN